MHQNNERTILVTGGAGYIGAHTCKALNEAGFTPVVVDNLSHGYRDFVRWGPLEVADIRDEAALIRIMRQYQPQAVMHFAGLIHVAESVEKPALYHEMNTGGTESVLRAMRICDVKNLVFSSTCAVYGEPKQLPITENAACAPVNPYGQSKLRAEEAIINAAEECGLRAMMLRYFNAAGADESGDIGEAHKPETHLIPLAIQAAMQGETLKIFGDDYTTPDGTALRDYIHVSDLGKAHMLALSYLRNNAGAHAVNVGVGTPYSVRQIVQAVEAELGTKITLEIAPRRAGDPPALYANTHKAKELLGFTPQYSTLANIVRNALRWHRRRI